MKIDKNGKALVGDFGISLVSSTSELNPLPREYQSVHYFGGSMYEWQVFERLKDCPLTTTASTTMEKEEEEEERNKTSYTIPNSTLHSMG